MNKSIRLLLVLIMLIKGLIMFNLNIMIDTISVRKRLVTIKRSDNKGRFIKFNFYLLFRDEDRSVVSETIGLVN